MFNVKSTGVDYLENFFKNVSDKKKIWKKQKFGIAKIF